jgi:hypothetical protein
MNKAIWIAVIVAINALNAFAGGGSDGTITVLYYNASELADRATYKANIKSGKWHAFKNGD